DLQAAIADARQAKAKVQEFNRLREKLDAAMRSGDPKKQVAAIDEVVAIDAALETTFGPDKFETLVKLGEKDKAVAYGQHLIKDVLNDSPDNLNNFAWNIVDPEKGSKPDARLVQVALSAARKADELANGKSPEIADTLAKALFDSGNAAR